MRARLELVNDDNPSAFEARTVAVVRSDLTIGDLPAIGVLIDPPIPAQPAPIAVAILAPRHLGISDGDFRAGLFESETSVFVSRPNGELSELPRQLDPRDYSVVFWGLLRKRP